MLLYINIWAQHIYGDIHETVSVVIFYFQESTEQINFWRLLVNWNYKIYLMELIDSLLKVMKKRRPVNYIFLWLLVFLTKINSFPCDDFLAFQQIMEIKSAQWHQSFDLVLETVTIQIEWNLNKTYNIVSNAGYDTAGLGNGTMRVTILL